MHRAKRNIVVGAMLLIASEGAPHRWVYEGVSAVSLDVDAHGLFSTTIAMDGHPIATPRSHGATHHA